MSDLKFHWDREGHPVCGSGWLLADDEGDVSCLSCLRILAEPWHGTVGGYRNHKCRCESCTEANRRYQADHRLRLALRPVPVHGTENGYSNYLCRCTLCRAAHTASARARRDARIEKMEQFHVRNQ